jgi:hypothetical protein
MFVAKHIVLIIFTDFGFDLQRWSVYWVPDWCYSSFFSECHYTEWHWRNVDWGLQRSESAIDYCNDPTIQ